jgi:hypothetical protein
MFFINSEDRGRMIGCINRNAIPIKSNGAAEIAAEDAPGGDHIFASLINKLALAASAAIARTTLIERNDFLNMMNE